MEISGETFHEVSLPLDGRNYVDCTLIRCTLEYAGSTPIRLTNCRVEDCQVTYHGAAAMTVEALQLVARSGSQGLDHVMRLFLPTAEIDWRALGATSDEAPAIL